MDKRCSYAPPDALPALRRKPLVGVVLTVDEVSYINDLSASDL
jgi:hypothetical protein